MLVEKGGGQEGDCWWQGESGCGVGAWQARRSAPGWCSFVGKLQQSLQHLSTCQACLTRLSFPPHPPNTRFCFPVCVCVCVCSGVPASLCVCVCVCEQYGWPGAVLTVVNIFFKRFLWPAAAATTSFLLLCGFYGCGCPAAVAATPPFRQSAPGPSFVVATKLKPEAAC